MRYWTLLPLLLAAGCTWVEPTPMGQGVTVAKSIHVKECKHVADTQSQVKSTVGPLNRDEQTVVEELTTLAKNQAADLGGDTIVALTAPQNGMMKFAIFNCRTK